MENKEENALSGILGGILVSAHQTSTSDNIWHLFGYKGFPDYGGSKLKVLFDYNNIKDKSFLLKEIVRMGVGIGLFKLINYKIISKEQLNKSINCIMSIILDNRGVAKALYLDTTIGQRNFYNFVYDYATAIPMDTSQITSGGMMGSFLYSLGPVGTFSKIFKKHAFAEEANDAKLSGAGLSKLINLFISSYDSSCKKVIDEFEIIDDL